MHYFQNERSCCLRYTNSSQSEKWLVKLFPLRSWLLLCLSWIIIVFHKYNLRGMEIDACCIHRYISWRCLFYRGVVEDFFCIEMLLFWYACYVHEDCCIVLLYRDICWRCLEMYFCMREDVCYVDMFIVHRCCWRCFLCRHNCCMEIWKFEPLANITASFTLFSSRLSQ